MTTTHDGGERADLSPLLMIQPQCAQDVFDTLRRGRLVEPSALDAFVQRFRGEPGDVATVLGQLVADGLVTAFQANEVGRGRGDKLWLGGYRLIDQLGHGGTSKVYLAEQPLLRRRVALKVLSEALRADPGARKRFVREAHAAAALEHPNIVRVFDVDMVHDPPYLVMEYIDGISLQAAVASTGTFSAGETATVGTQVADALAQAAVVGLVHRDIKPANLLLDRRGAVKVLDLGIARFMHDDSYSRLNGQNLLLGTLDYLAPEQAENSSGVDTRADIYSLGATLYFLLTGHPPYPIADVRQKLVAKKTLEPTSVQQLRPDIPTEFAVLIHQLLARDPAARPDSPAQVAAALVRWAVSGPDFPSRMFRAFASSTAHDRSSSSQSKLADVPNPLPETLQIVKKQLLPATGEANRTTSDPSEIPDGSPPAAPVPSPTAVARQTSDSDPVSATDVNPVIPMALPKTPGLAELLVPSAPSSTAQPTAPSPAVSTWPAPAESSQLAEQTAYRSVNRTTIDRAIIALAFVAGMTAATLIWLLAHTGR